MTSDTVSRTVVRERVPSGHGPERFAAPFTPPPVDRSDPANSEQGALIALSVVATVAVAAAVILLFTRGRRRSDGWWSGRFMRRSPRRRSTAPPTPRPTSPVPMRTPCSRSVIARVVSPAADHGVSDGRLRFG